MSDETVGPLSITPYLPQPSPKGGVYPAGAKIYKRAIISDDGIYRYQLMREWDTAVRPLHFIMLNPSTADGELDDPTIRRCVSIAVREGYGGIEVHNLYAFRATNPKDLPKDGTEYGPGNRRNLRDMLSWADYLQTRVVAGWGVNARPNDVEWLKRLPGADRLVSLGVTKDGHPRHPLMVRGDTPLTPWPPS